MNENIPKTLSIGAYCHCRRCFEEKPDDVSMKQWQRYSVGFTKIGLQIWCDRHDVNVLHLDFEGQKHPAATTP